MNREWMFKKNKEILMVSYDPKIQLSLYATEKSMVNMEGRKNGRKEGRREGGREGRKEEGREEGRKMPQILASLTEILDIIRFSKKEVYICLKVQSINR